VIPWLVVFVLAIWLLGKTLQEAPGQDQLVGPSDHNRADGISLAHLRYN
jgi:hypothetical protein